MARVGLRYSPSPNSDVLLSYIHSDIFDGTTFVLNAPLFLTDLQGSQFELQYIYRGEWLNLIAGLGDTNVDGTVGTAGMEKTPRFFTHQHSYLYTNIKFPKSITWTLGASYDDFEDIPTEVKKVNPKVWRPLGNHRQIVRPRRFLRMGKAAIDRRSHTGAYAGLRFQPSF